MSRLRRDGLPFEVTPATTRSRSSRPAVTPINTSHSNISTSSSNSRQDAAREARSRRANVLAQRRSRRARNNDLQLVHHHFSSLRASRADNTIESHGPTPLGISPFNSLQEVTESHVFKETAIDHDNNFECGFCGALLF